MKIGILTFHNADNYGAVLQCYALQEHLKKQYPNDEVYVIDYKNALIEHSYRVLGLRRSLFGNFTQFFYLPIALKKRKHFKDFKNKYLNLGTSDLSAYDVIYYGSDQIWNTSLTNVDLTFFGKGFNGKKIAYGASDGGEMEFSDEIKDLLNSFESISVHVSAVSDPVFFLSKEDWLKIAVLPKERNYVLAYKISDRPDFDEQAEKLGKQLGKKVIQIVYVKSLRKLFYRKQHFAEAISPEQFVGYFANADYVITTSFHGTAFSILFEKPFYVLSFEKRSERIMELLKLYHFENRHVDSL